MVPFLSPSVFVFVIGQNTYLTLCRLFLRAASSDVRPSVREPVLLLERGGVTPLVKFCVDQAGSASGLTNLEGLTVDNSAGVPSIKARSSEPSSSNSFAGIILHRSKVFMS